MGKGCELNCWDDAKARSCKVAKRDLMNKEPRKSGDLPVE
jgi:hypothetical protein